MRVVLFDKQTQTHVGTVESVEEMSEQLACERIDELADQFADTGRDGSEFIDFLTKHGFTLDRKTTCHWMDL